MADVASAANVSNGTLFNYFATKQELIDELYIWVKSDLAEAISAIDEELAINEQMRLIWDLWLEWASSQREAHAVMNLLHQSGLASEAARVKGSELAFQLDPSNSSVGKAVEIMSKRKKNT